MGSKLLNLQEFRSKSEAREWTWKQVSAPGIARFPFPADGRIPNFVGAELDADIRSKFMNTWETLQENIPAQWQVDELSYLARISQRSRQSFLV